ncbi:Maf family protein [Proteinivorax hydrogeniformans]|uniref:dTTP/UTP pyrophosphatase n=1 Tax=Proteinivorax hydrogeniformans TaxID=1826727 RepID=A0AAU8HWG7_9FIRM
MLILASKSPRRREILNKLPLKYQVISSNVNEKKFSEKNPAELSKSLAIAKAIEVSSKTKDYVLAADTVVSFDGNILGKPSSLEQCRMVLQMLSANKHYVITGVALCFEGTVIDAFYETTSVYFKPLSNQIIEWYISTEEPFDKAGGYGIQGKGGVFVERIEGCFYNVMGLPLSRTSELLTHHGIMKWGN